MKMGIFYFFNFKLEETDLEIIPVPIYNIQKKNIIFFYYSQCGVFCNHYMLLYSNYLIHQKPIVSINDLSLAYTYLHDIG